MFLLSNQQKKNFLFYLFLASLIHQHYLSHLYIEERISNFFIYFTDRLNIIHSQET